MNTTAVSTEVKPEGPIVAVQYPSTVEFESKPGIGKELAETYGHLKQLAVDDKKLYSELTKAIKAVVTLRTDNKKQEDVIKKPLNEFRSLVGTTGSGIRAEITEVENALKGEKSRIDDIRAELLAKQQQLWNENLQIIRARGQNLVGCSIEQLMNELAIIDLCNLDDLDFGDQLETAKAELANARIRTEQAIEQEKQRITLEEERAAFEAQRLKDLAEQAEKDYLIDWAFAIAEEENRVLQANLAKAQAASVPLVEVSDEEKEEIASTFAKTSDEGIAPGGRGSAKPNAALAAIETAASFDDPIIEIEAPVISEEDLGDLNDFIAKLQTVVNQAPEGFAYAPFNAAVDRVALSLSNAVGFLIKVKKGDS